MSFADRWIHHIENTIRSAPAISISGCDSRITSAWLLGFLPDVGQCEGTVGTADDRLRSSRTTSS